MSNNNLGTYYVVMNDGDTYCSEEDSFVYLLSDEGVDELDMSSRFSHVSDDHVVKKVSITDLIDCWIKANGQF